MATINERGGDPFTLPAGFYAIDDPHTPAKVTCWRRRTGKTSSFGPWPTSASQLHRELGTEQYMAYLSAVVEAISADPLAAQARFVKFTCQCARCGRPLRSHRWKVQGVGPECVAQLTDAERDALRDAVSRNWGALQVGDRP